jgi:hypothetical protein
MPWFDLKYSIQKANAAVLWENETRQECAKCATAQTGHKGDMNWIFPNPS